MRTKKSMNFVIYILTNSITKEVYVGKTNDLQRRMKEHKAMEDNDPDTNRKLHNSIRAYGAKCFNLDSPDVLECIDNDEDAAYEVEKKYIAHYDSYRNGLNSNAGGRGSRVWKYGTRTNKIDSDRSRGSKNPKAKLTDEQVLEIKQLINAGKSGVSIAKQFGVDKHTISRIKTGKAWAHIEFEYDDDIVLDIRKPENNPFFGKSHTEETKQLLSEIMRNREPPTISRSSKLTDEQVAEIKYLITVERIADKAIAKRFNVKPITIRDIRDGKTWKHIEITQSGTLKRTREGKNNSFYGKHHTDESKQMMSRSKKGQLAGDKNPMYGKHHTEEAKEKISKRKKRLPGSKNPSAKLTEFKVSIIKRLILEGEKSQTEIGNLFGVSLRTIECISGNETWKHVKWPEIEIKNKKIKAKK